MREQEKESSPINKQITPNGEEMMRFGLYNFVDSGEEIIVTDVLTGKQLGAFPRNSVGWVWRENSLMIEELVPQEAWQMTPAELLSKFAQSTCFNHGFKESI